MTGVPPAPTSEIENAKPRRPRPSQLRSSPEAIRMAFESGDFPYRTRISNHVCEEPMASLQVELLNVQGWVKNTGERAQRYFPRYIEKLPAGGEIVFFDRSWYNRAGVERVLPPGAKADCRA
jgi:polyphosphate kinase 2 (PPK2 family)